MHPYKTYFNWSSGKDSSFALFLILKDSRYNVDLLVTTINKHFNRVSMHGLRQNVLKAQVNALNLSLKTIELPKMPSMKDYEAIMLKATNSLVTNNYTHCVFGDIFLEDLRLYRDNKLKPFNITPIYPLWKMDTKKLISQFINLGFKAVVVCAKADYLNKGFVGQVITQQLIDNLPEPVDPCGENGEFHTFCFDGPIFSEPVNYKLGKKTYREYDTPNTKNRKSGFWFCDILLK